MSMQHDGPALSRTLEVAVHGGDAPDPGATTADGIDHLGPDRDLARGDGARKAAEILPVAQHHLHGKAELPLRVDIQRRHVLQVVEQSRPPIPGRGSRATRNVVAEYGRDGDRNRVAETEAARHRQKLGLDVAEALLRPVDQVHLVDGEDDARDAHQVQDRRVPPRLLLHARAGVDEQDRHVGVRGPRRHVARVLLVTGTVDDDETAAGRIEVAPGHVDGDALLALGGEAVHQAAEIRRAGGRCRPLAQRLLLVGVQRAGVPEHAADERGLAVVHRPASEHVQAACHVRLCTRERDQLRRARRTTRRAHGTAGIAVDAGEGRHQK
jgi:hypothetical protein